MQQAQADSENRIPRDIEAVPGEKYMFPCVTFFLNIDGSFSPESETNPATLIH